MRGRTHYLFAALALAACSSSSPTTYEQVSIADLDYRIPAGWTHRDLSSARRAHIEWAPPDREHQRLEIIRTAPRPALAKAGPSRLAQLLVQAEAGSAGARFTNPRSFTTVSGLTGVRIEGEVAAPGDARYHRRHAVLIDGDALLHVVQTGPDDASEAFDLVVGSFSRRGG